MKKTLFLLLILLQFLQLSVTAQVISFKKEDNKVLFQLQNQTMIITVCTENIIRVNYAQGSFIPAKKLLTVITNWGIIPFDVSESTESVTLKTSKLTVIVTKADATIGFYTPDGSLILQEDSKDISPQTVSNLNTFRCVATFKSPSDEAIYGLGQHQQSVMNFKGRTQTLDQTNMEIALPVILSNKGYGLLWNSYARTVFYGNYISSTKYRFDSEAGDQIDYYFFYGPQPDQIISAYRTATGSAPLFSKWAYGLFQSMDKYEKSSDLLNVASKYRKNHIPVDCIVQDWNYWNPSPWGSHKMNTANYPDPAKLIDSLHTQNLHTMISVWPVFTAGDANYNELNAIDAIYPSNGSRHYYDAYNDQARTIYWRQMKENLFGKYGWDAWWADSDEPDTYPDSYDRKALTTALGQGVLYYNAFPLMHTKGVYEGWRNDIKTKRVFTLSRSAFLGQQRNAAASWSGDIQSSWSDFKKQIPAGLNFALSGIPYWTTDIGGYWGTDWTTADNRELFTRWFEYGTFCPVFRIHGKLERTLYSETSWDAVTRTTLLKYDKLRYRLMPYIYSLAWKVTNENYTIMRHLIMDFPTDSRVSNISNQFMFGPYMMVNPIADRGIMSRPVYFPEGIWYDFWTGKLLDGGVTSTVNSPVDLLPLYVKAGSIIPMGPEIEYATQSIDPTEIRIYAGADGNFSLYDDAGDGYNYEQGERSVIPLSYNDTEKKLTIGTRQGSYPGMLQKRNFKIMWVTAGHGTGVDLPAECDSAVTYSGSELKIKFNAQKQFSKTHYEAEEAVLSSGVSVSAAFNGFMGTGYVTGLSQLANASIHFDVDIKKAGSYVVKLRYSAPDNSANTTLDLFSNGLKVKSLTCDKTLNGNSWSETAYILYLHEGINAVSFNAEFSNVNLDCIDISLPSEPQPLNTGLKKITRMRLQDTNLYLEEKDNSLVLSEKDENSKGQIWMIEKLQQPYYKISSSGSKKALTVDVSSGRAVLLSDFNGVVNQQWTIDEFGYDLARVNSKSDNKTLSVNSSQLVKDSDVCLSSQRWMLENPVIIANGNGLLGEYFKGTGFNTSVFKRIDPQINFNWGLNAPDASLPSDAFSIRWTGKIRPQYADQYTFYSRSDDGVRLWINDQQIIDDWTARALKENSGKISLEANKDYNIKYEYFDNAYDAIVSLEWSCPTLERQIIPQSQLFGGNVTGVSDLAGGGPVKMDVFPNPANSILNIEFRSAGFSPVCIEILNLQGMKIKSQSMNLLSGFQRVVMDIHGLKAGMYIIRLTSNEQISSRKIIVE